MLGTFIVYAVLSGLAMALGWISWSTPFFTFVAFAPLWYIITGLKKTIIAVHIYWWGVCVCCSFRCGMLWLPGGW